MPATNNRRMTMGSVNPNVNRRQTLDAGGPSNSLKPRSKRGRASMIPRVGRENGAPNSPAGGNSAKANRGRKSISDRRHSIVPPAPQAKSDPRPIQDKDYQRKCADDLLKFLSSSGYDYPLSLRSILQPSGKDFGNIVTFMLRRVDPTFQQDGNMKFEDEVAMNFKAMGYPYSISKTALVAAGSPHTFPTLLAALTWLMEHLLCISEDKVDDADYNVKPFDSLEELESQSDKAFFKYLGNAYIAFLQGDSRMTEELETAFADHFDQGERVIELEIDRLTDTNASVVEMMEQLSQENQDLENYVQKRDSYRSDLEQFHDLIRQMDERKKSMEQKFKERSVELENTNRKLARLNSRVDALRSAVSTQELSIDDLRKLENEFKGIVEAIDRAASLKTQRSKTLWESEGLLARSINELESVCTEYNTKLGELPLFPIISEGSAGMKISFHKDKTLNVDQKALLGADLTHVLQSFEVRKELLTDKIVQARKDIQLALDMVGATEEDFAEALEKRNIHVEKKSKFEDALSSEKEEQEAKLAVRLREVEAMEGKVQSLRDPVALEEQMARYDRQCGELEALRVQEHEEFTARKWRLQEEIQNSLRCIDEYETFCMQKCTELEADISMKMASLGELKGPSS